MIIDKKELTRFRKAFQGNSDAIDALDIIEQCDGNLADSMDILMAIEKDDYHLGDDQSWVDFENIINDLRSVICTSAFKSIFMNGSLPTALVYLLEHTHIVSKILLIPIMLYISQSGYDHFCQSEQS